MIGMGRLPVPGYFSIGSDGSVSATWFHGAQGADDSWRATFLWQPGEGFHVYLTHKAGSFSIEGDAAGLWLASMIDVGWGKDKAVDCSEWEDEDLVAALRHAKEVLGLAPPDEFQASVLRLVNACRDEVERRAAATHQSGTAKEEP